MKSYNAKLNYCNDLTMFDIHIHEYFEKFIK